MTYSTISIKSFLLILWLAAGCVIATAQTNFAQESQTKIYFETLAQAEAKTSAKTWSEAAALWEQIVKMNPTQGRSWNQLGTAHYNAKNYARAIASYEKALELGFDSANTAYNIACNYALLGEKEPALKWLEKAFELKFINLSHAQTDTDLQILRDDERYRKLVGLIDTSKMSREEGWRTDLQFLVRETKRRGWNLFPRIGTEAAFDAQVKKLHDAIPKLTDAQMAVELSKLLRSIGDGHSGLLGPTTARAEWAMTIPVLFYMFEEGLFIIAADPKHKDLLGSQVLKFGGRNVNELVGMIQQASSEDNKIWIKAIAPHRLRHLPLLHAAGAIPDANRVELNLRGMDGKERTVTLTTDLTQPNIWNVKPNPPEWVNLPQTLGTPVPLYLKNPSAKYFFEYLPDSKTVYFGFNSIRNDEKEPLAAFSERLFKFVNENAVEKLVIDLRWNNGGNTFLLTPLLQDLIKSEKINRRGNLFVIIGRRTYSAAQNASTFFERFTNAMFVGEPTGSSPNFVGEEDPFILPYSKIMANVSHLYWQSSIPQDTRTWVAPQIYTPPTFEAYRANRDSALEAILNYGVRTN